MAYGKEKRRGWKQPTYGQELAAEINEEFIDNIRRSNNKVFIKSGQAILVGCMNAHMQDLNGYTDDNDSV